MAGAAERFRVGFCLVQGESGRDGSVTGPATEFLDELDEQRVSKEGQRSRRSWEDVGWSVRSRSKHGWNATPQPPNRRRRWIDCRYRGESKAATCQWTQVESRWCEDQRGGSAKGDGGGRGLEKDGSTRKRSAAGGRKRDQVDARSTPGHHPTNLEPVRPDGQQRGTDGQCSRSSSSGSSSGGGGGSVAMAVAAAPPAIRSDGEGEDDDDDDDDDKRARCSVHRVSWPPSPPGPGPPSWSLILAPLVRRSALSPADLTRQRRPQGAQGPAGHGLFTAKAVVATAAQRDRNGGQWAAERALLRAMSHGHGREGKREWLLSACACLAAAALPDPSLRLLSTFFAPSKMMTTSNYGAVAWGLGHLSPDLGSSTGRAPPSEIATRTQCSHPVVSYYYAFWQSGETSNHPTACDFQLRLPLRAARLLWHPISWR